jgi:hypothetical protein
MRCTRRSNVRWADIELGRSVESADEPGDAEGRHADGVAQEVYERAPEPKEISWIETTNHVELHDGAPHVAQALERILPWLEENMKSRADEGSAI